MAVDWTQLPPEIVEAIAKNLTVYTDYVRFQAVCRTWRSSIPKIPNHLPPQLPWLMLPQSHQPHCAFFDLSADEFRFLNLPQVSHRNRHCGSSHGWLVILDDSPTILLLNPLTRAKIYLPPLPTFPTVVSFNYSNVGREYLLQNPSGDRFTFSLSRMRDSFVRKIVLSSSPANDNAFVAMAILNETADLAYCRNGDQSWTIVEFAFPNCEDVIYHNGLFYAVNKFGEIAMCDVCGHSPRVSIIQMPSLPGADLQYLVGSGDEILLVSRYLVIDFDFKPYRQFLVYRTETFLVFRLDWNEPHRWEMVKSLGDRVLFVGENSSLSLSATDFPGCTGNCIYYTDNYSEYNYDGPFGQHDLGIFYLCDGSFEPLPCYHQRNSLPPIWVSPNPC